MNLKSLSARQWGQLHNTGQLQRLVRSIKEEKYSVWTEEILRITKRGDKVLELGGGSGQTSLALAKNGRDVTMLDFSDEVLALGCSAAKQLGLKVAMILQDITIVPKFCSHGEFDFIYSAGLLEHFDMQERVNILKNWKPFCEKMISMIPNSASLAYHLGKEMQEINGTWIWGKEIPSYTQIKEFMLAGYEVENEYTIGELHSLNFLDEDDELKALLNRLWKDRISNGLTYNFHQGYLVVTIGR